MEPTLLHTAAPNPQRVVLLNGALWEDGNGLSLRALLFGQMVQRAVPFIEAYHSDLYHDAMWLADTVHGETNFEWLVRSHGTNIAESAELNAKISGDGRVFYNIALTCERGNRWVATFTWIDLAQVRARP